MSILLLGVSSVDFIYHVKKKKKKKTIYIDYIYAIFLVILYTCKNFSTDYIYESESLKGC
jgi:hypothetical protein